MARLSVFNNISLDGYFTDAQSDMSWAHRAGDAEWDAYVAGNAQGRGRLLFGRVTYDMMAAYWPTPAAAQLNPIVAERVNAGQKIVFSKTMRDASWANTRVAHDALSDVRAMKQDGGPDMVILGSGAIVAQLAKADLIDAFQMVMIPIVIGAGRTMFEGVRRNLTLTNTRAFKNGNALLCYERGG